MVYNLYRLIHMNRYCRKKSCRPLRRRHQKYIIKNYFPFSKVVFLNIQDNSPIFINDILYSFLDNILVLFLGKEQLILDVIVDIVLSIDNSRYLHNDVVLLCF